MLFQRQSLLILLAGVTSVGAFTITTNTFVTPSYKRSSTNDSENYLSDLTPPSTVESSSDDGDAVVTEVAAPESVAEEEAPSMELDSSSDSDDVATASTDETEEKEVPVESSSDGDAVAVADPVEATGGEEESKQGDTKKKQRHRRPNTAYVVNLSYETTNADLRTLFTEYGKVESVYVPMDKKNDRPKGIAFISMSSEDELEAALEGLKELELGGRRIY